MASFDLTAASNILKTRYIGPIREQLNNGTILMSRIMKDTSTQSVSGKSFTVPLHTSRNRTAGRGTSDGGALQTAATQGYDVAVVPNKYQYAVIEVTGPTVAATKDNAGAFVQALDSEINGAVRDMKRAMNRQMHSDGTDRLAVWTGADDATTANVDDGRGNYFVHLQSGATTCDVIDYSSGSTGTVLGNSIALTLGGSSSAGYTVAWSAGTISGTADNDYVVLEDSLGYQLMGLDGIISTGDPLLLSAGLHGLAAASNSWWQSQVVSNSGTNRALTLELMQQPLDLIATNSDYTDQDVEFLMSSYGVRAKYIAQLVADKRHVNTMNLDGGFKGVEFNGIPLVPDPQCKKNRIYYIVPECLKIFRTSDFDWMSKDGSQLARVDGYDKYRAVLYHYGDLACVCRNGLGLLDDLSE